MGTEDDDDELQTAEFQHGEDQDYELRLAGLQRGEDRAVEAFKAGIGWASFALKASITINGGSALALMALFGHVLASGEDNGRELLANMAPAMSWFAFGMFLGTAAAGLAFLGDNRYFHSLVHPYDWLKVKSGEYKPSDRKAYPWITIVLWVAVGCLVTSAFAFLSGSLTATCGAMRALHVPLIIGCSIF